MTAEELLTHLADLISQFNTPAPDAAGSHDSDDSDDSGHMVGKQLTRDSPVPSDGNAPWENLTGAPSVNLLYKMPEDIFLKMKWVMDNVPRMSKQRIVRDAVVTYLDALIAQHYKGA